MFILRNIFSSRNWWKRPYYFKRDPIFEQKREEALEKKFNCTFIRFNTSNENFDVNYELGKIQMFISQFKDDKIKGRDDKIKEMDNENKELKDEIEKLKLLVANLSVKNNDDNDKNK